MRLRSPIPSGPVLIVLSIGVFALAIARTGPGASSPVRNLRQRLHDHIDSLADAGGTSSRVVFTPGNRWSVGYILRSMRRDAPDAHLDTFPAARRSTRARSMLANVVARVPGRSDSLLVLCAHLDASASRDPGWGRNWMRMRAPGADDNATGVAALLEILTLVRHAPSPPRYTLLFVACNGEERNPDYRVRGRDGHHLGSRYVAARLAADSVERVRGVIALDMVGYNPDRTTTAVFATPRSEPLARELRAENERLRLKIRLSRGGACRNSDNESFDRFGIPAVLFMESCAPWRSGPGQPRNPAYHSGRDLPGTVNYEILESVTRLVTAYLLR